MTLKDCKNTVNWFLYISGTSDTEEALKLCAPAVETVERSLLSKNFQVAAIPALYCAAACLAYYRYCLLRHMDAESFNAGEVSVRFSGKDSAGNAKELLASALSDASVYLKNGAVLKSVGGLK